MSSTDSEDPRDLVCIKSSDYKTDKETADDLWYNDLMAHHITQVQPEDITAWKRLAEEYEAQGLVARELPFAFEHAEEVELRWKYMSDEDFRELHTKAKESMELYPRMPPPRPWNDIPTGRNHPNLISDLLAIREDATETLKGRLQPFLGDIKTAAAVAEGLLYWAEYAIRPDPPQSFRSTKNADGIIPCAEAVISRLNNCYIKSETGIEYMEAQRLAKKSRNTSLRTTGRQRTALNTLTSFHEMALDGKYLFDRAQMPAARGD